MFSFSLILTYREKKTRKETSMLVVLSCFTLLVSQWIGLGRPFEDHPFTFLARTILVGKDPFGWGVTPSPFKDPTFNSLNVKNGQANDTQCAEIRDELTWKTSYVYIIKQFSYGTNGLNFKLGLNTVISIRHVNVKWATLTDKNAKFKGSKS